MGLFPAIAIIIVVLVIIIIVIVVVVIVTNQSKGSTANNVCTNQNDCASGYVCTHTETSLIGTCKAGIGTSCNNDTDCSTDLICSTPNNSSNKVCTRRNITPPNITLATSLPQPNLASLLRRTSLPTPESPASNSVVNDSLPEVSSTVINNPDTHPTRNIIRTSLPKTIDVCTPLTPDKRLVNIMQSPSLTLDNKLLNTMQSSPNPESQQDHQSNIRHISNIPSIRSCTPLSEDNNLPTDDNILQTTTINSGPVLYNQNGSQNSTVNPELVVHNHNSPINTGLVVDNQNSPINTGPVPDNQNSTRRIGMIKGARREGVTPLSDLMSIMRTDDVRTNRSVTDSTRTDVVKAVSAIPTDRQINPRTVNTLQDAMVRNVIPYSKRPIQREVTSLDDEQNSDGDYTGGMLGRFDVRSGNSTKNTLDSDDRYSTRQKIVKESDNNYNIASVSTPCEEKDGVYYCRSNKTTIEGKIDHSPVIDVCSYSNATIFLLEDGNIICEMDKDTKERYRTSNNIPLIRITSFDGYLHGIGWDHKLYTLPNSYFATTNWVWNLADWAPTDIKHISSTHDSSYLWIQTSSTGLLYSAPGVISSKTPFVNLKRVYGRDVNHYIDIDTTKFTAKNYPGGTLVNNVYDGALSYYDEIIAIHPSERNKYRGITIVNWVPYYIRV